MTSGELLPIVLAGAGIGALVLAELVDRRNGTNRHDTDRTAKSPVSWRSLQALERSLTNTPVDRADGTRRPSPGNHAQTGVTR